MSAALLASLAAAAEAPTVLVLAQFEEQALRIESFPLRPPLHHAGAYAEWVNQREFLANQRLVEHARYEVTAAVVRTEVRRFPSGWGERSGKYYSTFYLEARSLVEAPK